jgi:hypothetical protein
MVTVSAIIGDGGRNKHLTSEVKRTMPTLARWAQGNIVVNLFNTHERDRRGWLMNGASAALHISRTQLSHPDCAHSQSDTFSIDEFKHIPASGRDDAAIATLLDKGNWNIVLNEGDPEDAIVANEQIDEKGKRIITPTYSMRPELFYHQARSNLFLLEKMADYEKIRLEAAALVQIKLPSNGPLTGWDFMDIVTHESSLKRKAYETRPEWATLLETIGAITLFGQEFGSLISPSTYAGVCDRWREVPRERDYLAAGVPTLDIIRRRFSAIRPGPLQIIPGLYWYNPDKLFTCQCQDRGPFCNRAQELRSLGPQQDEVQPFKYGEGAIIFSGCSSVLHKTQKPARSPLPSPDPEERRKSVNGRIKALLSRASRGSSQTLSSSSS